MRATVVIALVLAGCSFPTKPGDPFACDGDPVPMTAPDVINIHVSARDPLLGNPVPSSIKETIDGVSATGMTDANGDYDAQLTTLGLPHAASIESDPVDSAKYLTTIGYPALPVASDQDITIFHFQSSSFVDPRTQMAIDPSTVSIAIIAVVDCNDKSVGGATVSVTDKGTGQPAGTIIYISSTFGNLDPSAVMTDAVTGAAFVIGLTDGETVTIDASLSGVTFQHHDIKVTMGAITFAEVSP